MTINSPFASLFIAIQAHIKTRVPAIRYIDQDYGQLDFFEGRPPVSFPAVLINLDAFTFSEMGENTQVCEGDIVIRLAFAPFSSSSNLVPKETRHLALEYYNLEWLLNKALHGWAPDMTDTGDFIPEDFTEEDLMVMEATAYQFGHLTRTASSIEQRKDNIRVRDIRYRIAFEDYSTQLDYTMTPATPVITGEIED